jgi:hypothetical protein
MNIHKNAWTTPRSRGQIMARVLTQRERPAVWVARLRRQRWPEAQIAQALHLSALTIALIAVHT